ncbi:MAG: sulfotransferase [Chloroflexota bacterium]|nr:sulfotransferase [Chloroflexota bacterium]
MFENDVILTGLPRSGTTLTCHLLNKLPDTVALHEPMQGLARKEAPNPEAMRRELKDFFDEQRVSIRERGRALSRNIDGVVPDNPFAGERSADGVRRQVDAKGEIVVDKDLSDRFMLVIKHTNRFAPMLGALVESFPVYAIVRNPLATLASWRTIDAGIRVGRTGPAGRLAPDLRVEMDRLEDELDRQVYLLNWFWEQFLRHLPDRSIIRYEALIESGGRALNVIRPEAEQLAEPLENLNANRLYDHDDMQRIGDRLLRGEGAYWQMYSKESVRTLLNQLQHSPVQ